MGLTGFNKFVREHGGDFEEDFELANLRGYRVAIDANWSAYRNASVAYDRAIAETNILEEDPDEFLILSYFLEITLKNIVKFLKMKIIPIFVLDGPRIEAKKVTTDDREKKKEKAQNKILEIRRALIDGDSHDFEHCREEIRKAIKATVHFTEFMRNGAMNMMISLGIPFMQSKHDGEKLCSSLCIEKKVACVMAEDTDCYAFGCPRLITKITETVTIDDDNIACFGTLTRNKNVRRLLGVTPSELIDIFIMTGCDYNGKGLYGIGAIKAYGLVRQYGCIENLPDNYDIKSLNYEECREIFAYARSEDYILKSNDLMNLDIERLEEYGRDILERYNLGFMYEDLHRLFENMPESTPGIPDELKSIVIVEN